MVFFNILKKHFFSWKLLTILLMPEVKKYSLKPVASIPTAFLLGLFMTACETVENNPPPTSTVDSRTTESTARSVRWDLPGGMVSKGSGISMAPIYGDNTVFVITPIEFDQLEEGMIVAYRNKWGDQVVHQLVKRNGHKWVVKGLNNEQADSEPVTKKNLIGAVYAVFNSAAPPDV